MINKRIFFKKSQAKKIKLSRHNFLLKGSTVWCCQCSFKFYIYVYIHVCMYIKFKMFKWMEIKKKNPNENKNFSEQNFHHFWVTGSQRSRIHEDRDWIFCVKAVSCIRPNYPQSKFYLLNGFRCDTLFWRYPWQWVDTVWVNKVMKPKGICVGKDNQGCLQVWCY